MDKDFVKKYGLLESQKKFKQLVEYTFITSPISEDDDNQDDMNNQNNNNNNPDMNMQNQNAEIGGTEDISGETGNSEVGSDNNSEVQNQPQNNGDNSLSNAIDNIENNKQDFDDNSDSSSEDEYVDVEDLTDSQEESERKIDFANKKINQVISKIDSFIDAINKNDTKIEELENELKRRVPTQDEKLNLRSQDSYPYSINPKDYWKNNKNPNYDVIFDNNVNTSDEDKEYEIRKGDIDGDSDKTIYDTLDDLEDGMNLYKIFRY